MAELGFLSSSHQLEREARQTAAVQPLSLPWGQAPVRPGEVCSVAGWGKVSIDTLATTLQEVELTVQQDQECKFYFSNNYNSTTQLCVGDPKEKKSSFQVRLSICLAQLWGEGCLGKIWDLESQAVGTPSPPRL